MQPLTPIKCCRVILSGVLAFLIPASTCVAVSYELAVADSMERVRIDQPYTGPKAKAGAMNTRPHPGSVENAVRDIKRTTIIGTKPLEVSLSAAGNEAEGFQIVIMPKEADLKNVKVTASPFSRGGSSRSIPAKQVTFQQVGYVKTRRPSYGVERSGWFADPLSSIVSPRTIR